MFTPERLLNIAVEAERQAKSNPASAFEARRTAQEAIACAVWMEKNGIPELPCVGPFTDRLPRRGDKVRIKAGAKISSTSDRSRRILTRAYKVTVHDAFLGSVRDGDISQPTVHWAGSGGYWCWTDLASVEFLD